MGERHLHHGPHHERPATHAHPAPSPRLLRTLQPAGRAWFNRRYDVHVAGLQHVPARGPAIVAANHIGWLDGPLMAAYTPRAVHALTKREMFEGRLGRFLRAVGQIPLDRMLVDSAAVRGALRVLRDGGVVGIFPEGARGSGEVAHARGGAAYLALVTGAPVVPLAILGTREPGAWSESVPPRGTRIHLGFGSPICLDPQPWPRRKADVRDATERIRRKLQSHVQRAVAETGLDLPGPLRADDPMLEEEDA